MGYYQRRKYNKNLYFGKLLEHNGLRSDPSEEKLCSNSLLMSWCLKHKQDTKNKQMEI